MVTAAPARQTSLDKASELARTSIATRHSSEHAWQQASALALVSIAQSLESITAAIERTEGRTWQANGGKSRREDKPALVER